MLLQVFVCGSYPHWLFVTSRGALRAHPMNIDGAVTCFAPFHNVNCPKGFLYFNKKVDHDRKDGASKKLSIFV